MIIKDINKKIKETPDNLTEELAPISNEYIRGLFEGLSGDDCNPLDHYTKTQVDQKIQIIDDAIDSIERAITSSNDRVATLEGRVSTMKNITYSTSEPTDEQGQDGDLWIIYEE